MKQMILTLAVLILATSAQAANLQLNYYVIDMTGARFVNQTFNEMDDGIADIPENGFDGYAVKLQGQLNKDYTVKTRGSEAGVTCEVVPVSQTLKSSFLQLRSSVETDSGETCEYEITYTNGKRAVLSVFSEGT